MLPHASCCLRNAHFYLIRMNGSGLDKCDGRAIERQANRLMSYAHLVHLAVLLLEHLIVRQGGTPILTSQAGH